MITALEEAALTRITEKVASITSSGTQGDTRQLLTSQSVAVAALEGTFKRASKSTWRQDVTLSVLVKFKNVQSEEARRKGINPLIKAIILLLVNQDFDLKIAPLEPKSFRDATTKEKYDAGVIEYLLEFETGFYIQAESDELVTDLLTIGLNYYLQDPADDQIADAGDVVNLEQQ